MSNTLQQLNEKLKNSRLIAGRNIKLEYTGNGIRIHGSAENTGGSVVYNGGFKIVKGDDNLNVVYGDDPDNANCGGFAYPNSMSYLPVPAISFPITGELHYITLRLIYNTSTKLYQAEIVNKTDGWADYVDPDGYPRLKFEVRHFSCSKAD